jgi:asparagine N-glycosylation enzyme membrane subunit Stt3
MSTFFDKLSNLSLKQKLLIIVGIGFVIKVLTFWTHPTLHRDSVLYMSINYHVINGDVNKGLALYPECPPALLYSLKWMSAFGNPEFCFRCMSLVLYTLVVVPFYFIVRHFTNQRAALLAAFIISVHPKIIDYSHCVLRESISFPFIVFGVFFTVYSYQNKKLWPATLAGLCFSICYMARIEYGLAVFMGIATYLMYLTYQKMFSKEWDLLALKIMSIISVSILPLLFLADWSLKGTVSIWDPWAYHKLEGFFRMFGDWLWK